MEELSNPIEQTENDWQIGQKLGTCMLHLYTNNIWTDVTFRCQGHVEDDKADRIHAHKIVLAARSPFFQGMFFGHWSEDKTDFDLLTTESKTLDLLLRYVYSEETDLNESNAEDVLALAHMYQMPCLVNYCANFLRSVLRPDSACGILELALLYQVPELRAAACFCIDQNAKEVLNSDSFFGISSTCLAYILKGDTFFEDETYIFDKAVEWSEHKFPIKDGLMDGKAKRKKLERAFYYLRLPTLGNHEFLKCTKGKGFYTVPEIENIFSAINDKESSVIPCHSIVTRVPRKTITEVPPFKEDTLGEAKIGSYNYPVVQTIECTLLAKVSRDCSISGFTLKNMEPFVIATSNETSKMCYKKDTTVEVPLDCILSVDDTTARTKIRWHNKELSFYLKKPIALCKKDTYNVITFKLSYKCEHSNICLRTVSPIGLKDVCQGNGHSNTCLSKLRSAYGIAICYCNGSKHVNCIKNFTISNHSNRSTDDAFH